MARQGPPAAPVNVGDVISGKYAVESIVGEGGMGVVVSARHLQLDERVAIKLLRPESLANSEAVTRFTREARAAVKIKSAHVARILDVDQLESGAPYIVMEHLEGETLEARLERGGPVPISQAVDWIVEACDAIAEAHLLGIIHRDLKPANLFLATLPNGFKQIKVLDFGISKTASPNVSPPADEPGSVPPSSGFTKSRIWMGTPHYMAPEQMRSARRVDVRADVWSLGVTLFEVLSKRLPFEAQDYREIAILVTQGKPMALRNVRPEVPAGLEGIVSRCLERERERRYPSVVDLAKALAPYGSDRSQNVLSTIARPARAPSDDQDGDEPTMIRRGPLEPVEPEFAREAPSGHTLVDTPRFSRPPSDAPPEEPLTAGPGKYRVLFELGEGGTAKVLLGVAHGMGGFNKLVVLKVLRDDIARFPEASKMFMEEARLSARLNHKNVVEVYEVSLQDGKPVIVMAYLDGQSLREIIDEAGTNLSRPMHWAILAEMLSGLHYSHELADYDGTTLGLVHRDVSPHNVFVTIDGTVKVLDFGLAKLSHTKREHTRTGVIKGKVRYMAPEQIRGDKRIDRRADIFAAGVMLWEAIAGRRLWKGIHEGQVMARVMAGDIPRPSQFWPECPPELERTCMRALSLKKENRHATAAELQTEIEDCVERLGHVLPRDISKFMTQHFGHTRDARLRIIEDMLGKPRSLPRFEPKQNFKPLPAEASLTLAAARRAQEPEGSTRSFALRAGLAAAAVLGAVGVALAGVRLFAAEPPPVASTTVAAPQPPSSVRVNVTVFPADARVLLDGVELPSNPYSFLTARDGSRHQITATAPGHIPLQRALFYDADLEVVLTMRPSPIAGASAGSAKTHPPPSHPAGSPVRQGPGGGAPRVAAPPAVQPAPQAPPACDRPFIIDANGIKRYNRDCL
jgi:serine/threonine-protein kinase